MLSLLKNIFSLFSHPLFVSYKDHIRHRFHNHLLAAFILITYEFLMLFFSTPHVRGLQNGEVWFQVLSYLPFRSLLVSLGIIIIYSINIRRDYRGIRDEKEEAAFRMDEAKNMADLMQGKPIKPIPPKIVWRLNWLHTLRMFCEGFVFAAILFALLPYVTEGVLSVIAPSTPLPMRQPKQLLFYETNAIQSFAIACGSGFYEEFIFRYQLIRLLNQVLIKYIKPFTSPYLVQTFDKTKWLHTRRFGASILISALIYSLSHILIPTGESANPYIFCYHFLFALAMTWVMTQRKFGVAVLTHTLYGIFYFLTV